MGYPNLDDSFSQKFQTMYQRGPDIMAHAPGRAEIIGNHTDYNNGYALSCGISRYTTVTVGKRDDRTVRVYSPGYSQEPSEFSLDAMQKGEHGHWLNYVKGVLAEVMKLKSDIPGMDILIESDVPSSGGVSSSAALELALFTAVAALHTIEIDAVKKSHLCQKAENGDLIGIPCGFLDQASSGLAQKDNLLFLDFLPAGDLPVSAIRQIPFSLADYDMSFVVIVDKEVKRNLGTSGYPARRKMCEDSLPHLAQMLNKEIHSLRDVSIDEFESCREKLDAMNPTMRKRVEHIVYENQRVLDAVEKLGNKETRLLDGQVEKFGKILTESGKSALELYELDEKTPELTKLVTRGREIDGVVGMRNMGGGFSAIALALVQNTHLDSFEKALAAAYGPGLEFIPFTLSQGAEIM